MNFKFKYGQSEIEFSLEDKNVLGVLSLSKTVEKLPDLKSAITNSLKNPIGASPLVELIKENNPKKIAVILEDITRPNRDYNVILSALIAELKEAGLQPKSETTRVKFVIAYGTHRKQTEEESLNLYGQETFDFGEVINHDCDDRKHLSSVGLLSDGEDLMINKHVAEADLVIATGNIEPHTFAGYGGGRKAILPGVSSRKNIRMNHAKVICENVGFGILKNNPINLGMVEAAKLVAKNRLLFILNIIRNDKKEVVKVVSGDIEKAFNEGVKFSEQMFTVKVKQLADVTIVSPGGTPKDMNLYQSQKALTAASYLTRKGGTIILVSECREGVGQPVFEKWMEVYSTKEILCKDEREIEVEGHRAYLTAKILDEIETIMVSSMPCEKVKKLKFSYSETMQEAIESVKKKYGENFKAYIIPNGSSILPVLER
ncbi:MAG: nickel-dependent lactate racemase [Elusimicrobiota bacterium]